MQKKLEIVIVFFTYTIIEAYTCINLSNKTSALKYYTSINYPVIKSLIMHYILCAVPFYVLYMGADLCDFLCGHFIA